MKAFWEDKAFKEKMHKSFSKSRKKSWEDEDFKKRTLSKLSEGIQNFWNDPEKRANRIKNITGRKNPNAKSVRNIETGKIFFTIKEAAVWCGLKDVGGIGQCCKKKRKTSGKHPITKIPLHWEYYKGGEE